MTRVQAAKAVSVEQAQRDGDGQDVPAGGFQRQQRRRLMLEMQLAGKRNHHRRRRPADHGAEQQRREGRQMQESPAEKADNREAGGEAQAAEDDARPQRTPQHVQAQFQAAFEQNQDQGDGGERGPDRAEALRADAVEYRAEQEPDNQQKKGVGNAGALRDAGQQMRQKDQRADEGYDGGNRLHKGFASV